ncbi:MAG: CBS domain-containing protein [Alphaproteobacteria bacterium]
MKRRLISELMTKQGLVTLAPDATAREAARAMAERGVGAVLVTDGHTLVGILTERDVTNRVDAQGRDPDTTPIGEVMTRKPLTVSPDDPAINGLRILKSEGFRHLPVTRGARLVGMLSARDFTSEELAEVEEEVAFQQAFVEGGVERT